MPPAPRRGLTGGDGIGTAEIQGSLWGAAAEDWSALVEPLSKLADRRTSRVPPGMFPACGSVGPPVCSCQEKSCCRMTPSSPNGSPLRAAPTASAPAATAGDVLQGAVAAVLLLMMVAGLAGLMIMVVKRQEVGADEWGVAEWIFFAVASGLMVVGAFAAFRSLRYYLTGRHRLRVTRERES